VDDRVGLGFEDGFAHSGPVEQIECNGLRPEHP
jgi:hypothetical protein